MRLTLVSIVIFGLLVGFLVFDIRSNAALKEQLVAEYQSKPVEIVPPQHVEAMHKKGFSCDIHDEGTSKQHLTCWFAVGNPMVGTLTLIGPRPLSFSLLFGRITPEKILNPGGDPIFSLVRMME